MVAEQIEAMGWSVSGIMYGGGLNDGDGAEHGNGGRVWWHDGTRRPFGARL